MKFMLGNNSLVQCEDFIYLGGVISQDSTCDKDVAWRIGLAAGIVRNLGKIWKAKDISKTTKVLLYQTLIQSVISYNSDTRTLKEEHKRKLRVFEMSVLRKISGVTRRDHVRNLDILKDLTIDKDIIDILQIRRLTYFGHVIRMAPCRYLHILFHG